MCNLAGGLAIDATQPPSHRWIPKGMTVAYLKAATTDLLASARCTLPESLGETTDVIVTVDVRDTNEAIVFRALISMHISQRKPR